MDLHVGYDLLLYTFIFLRRTELERQVLKL